MRIIIRTIEHGINMHADFSPQQDTEFHPILYRVL